MNNENLQKICADKLTGIASMVLSEDRKEAMKELDISYQTILRYLAGKVVNLDLGVKLYEFFSKRIEKRKEVLTA